MFDLLGYAKQHRLRTRNLHDGGPVPPARCKPRIPAARQAFAGAEDRWDAIVGRDGYVAMDGDRLSIYLCYKSGRGVKAALAKIRALGGEIQQEGDFELGATLPSDNISEALELIRPSRVPPGGPGASADEMARVRLGKESCTQGGLWRQDRTKPNQPGQDTTQGVSGAVPGGGGC